VAASAATSIGIFRIRLPLSQYSPDSLSIRLSQAKTIAVRGTIAAKTSFPDSASSQFFINLDDNLQFDRAPNDPGNLSGYAVFGRVIGGMAGVDAIAMVQLGGGVGPPLPAARPRSGRRSRSMRGFMVAPRVAWRRPSYTTEQQR
jgi:cyclophilin family peptidyl-prolyl cis-trans isomerase